MIERFNFYDVYGYFLPGLVLLTLFWVPFGVVQHFWPPNELSSALAALGFAYILGHLLQTLATNAIPSRLRKAGGRYRFPSELLLDASDPTFSRVFKQQLGERVRSALNIDLEENAEADEQISRKRQDAFFLSRGILIREKIASYAEQFEGMYALMRGLTIAFFLACIYLAGWSASLFKREWLRPTAVVTALAALAFAVIAGVAIARSGRPTTPNLDRASIGALSIALLAAGYRFGFERLTSPRHSVVLFLASIAALFACIRFLAAYRYFAQEFAKAVWRDFAAYQITRSQPNA